MSVYHAAGFAMHEVERQLARIAAIIEQMADPDIFVWLGRKEPPTEAEIHRAATIVADRLCGAVANPIIRNAQEKRQLAAIKAWLEERDYRQLPGGEGTRFHAMPPGTFSFRMNVPVKLEGGVRSVNIPIDAAAFVNSEAVEESSVLALNDRLEFVKAVGFKGLGDLFRNRERLVDRRPEPLERSAGRANKLRHHAGMGARRLA